jgi:hypothetical protein
MATALILVMALAGGSFIGGIGFSAYQTRLVTRELATAGALRSLPL